jgi:D-alanine-D-alanine ligase
VKKRYKVLALFDGVEPTTLNQDFSEEFKTEEWATEAHVIAALDDLRYPCEQLAIYDDTDLIRQKLATFQPDIIFNLVERFKEVSAFDQNIVSFLEIQDVPFTGCGSLGLTLSKHKGISKQILSYHNIRVPEFAVLPRGKRITRPRRLGFPVFVKPAKEEASIGIAQASFVESDEDFNQRVAFIHEKFQQDAIAEEYIDGRELYVSVLGNDRLQVLPIRELTFKQVPPDEPKIASYNAKWNAAYRKKWGIENEFASGLDEAAIRRTEHTCRRIYRLLGITGYARLDMRLTPQGELVFIEANPNPILARDEDFALSGRKAKIPYPRLIQKIIQLGLSAGRS